MNMRVRVLLKIAAFLVLAVPLFSQITITPTAVTIQSSTDEFCALRPVNGQVQYYCFGTVTTPWDKLIFNSIFPVDADSGSILIPDVIRLPKGCFLSILNPANPPCQIKSQIMAIVWWDGTKVNYQVGLNGTGNVQTNHF